MSETRRPPRVVASLSHVEELTLLGKADLAWWVERLEPLGLRPLADQDGQAQVLLICAASRYLGIKFREVSVSILAGPREAARWPGPGSYLLQAFNSVRWFAWCERTFFSTPYRLARIEMALAPAPRVAVLWNGLPVFSARMQTRAGGALDPAGSAGEAMAPGWSGPVFLPPPAATPPGRGPRKFFLATIAGAARVVDFDPGLDQVSVGVPAGLEGQQALQSLQALLDSRFAPLRWLIRSDAKHSKSRTCKLRG